MKKFLAILFFFTCSYALVPGNAYLHSALSQPVVYTHGFLDALPISRLQTPLATGMVTTEEENRSEEEPKVNTFEDPQHHVIEFLRQTLGRCGKPDSLAKKPPRLFALYHHWRSDLMN